MPNNGVTHYLGDDCPGGHLDEAVVFNTLIAQGMPGDKAREVIRRIKREQDAERKSS